MTDAELQSTSFRILVVDDNAAIHDDMRKVLGHATSAEQDLAADEAILFGEKRPDKPAFELEFAYQGQEALALVQHAQDEGRPFALAFVDIRMPPGWDGVETIGHLWAVDPDLQVVVCTAYSDYSWNKMVRCLGPSDNLIILKKPFDNIEVVQLAHALTRKWLMTRQARLRLEDLDRLVDQRTAELLATSHRLRQAQKVEAVGRLVAGIAHHFNNLHAIIQGNLSLCDEATRDPQARECLSEIAAASRRAAALTQELLAFSRKQSLSLQPVDLNQFLLELRPQLAQTFGPAVDLQFQFASDLPTLTIDPNCLDWSVRQLCVNASDAMPHGGRCIIRTALAPAAELNPPPDLPAEPGHFFCLSVTDTGVGMEPAVLERLFEPFFTTKDVGKGYGLALASIHGLVRQHHGWIEVASRPGAGSTFRLYLPAGGPTGTENLRTA